MKSLPSFGRNDVIRAIALISMVAFPLIADAQLGLGAKAVKPSKEVAPLSDGTVKAAIVSRESCADQHWPFLSNGCLRGSAEAIKPRLVSMSVEQPANSGATNDPAKVVRAADAAQANAPFAKPRKNIKPRVATHRRERNNVSVKYAVNSEMGHMSLAGW
jgi:hypothetical protein